jgi:hypothetical protein
VIVLAVRVADDLAGAERSKHRVEIDRAVDQKTAILTPNDCRFAAGVRSNIADDG